ncbi:MAG: hypothetical protein IPJ31_03635 [Bacteroidetes bacterium]|nr:hypothetical protein [Bacteroidota bacterium]
MKGTPFAILVAMCLGLISFDTENRITFSLGQQTCILIQTITKPGALNFIALHDDENTAVKAFHSWTSELNINLLELHQNNDRYLKYQIGSMVFSIDPNKIFTEKGIANTLNSNYLKYPKELPIKIKQFADSLLTYFVDSSKRAYTIAIHNNSEANYSILNYKNPRLASKVFISSNEDIDDFFIVIDSLDFDFFKNLDQNVALQNIEADDDGSLSIYCHKNKIPYINIEAQDGHLAKQIEMIKLAYYLVTEKKL